MRSITAEEMPVRHRRGVEKTTSSACRCQQGGRHNALSSAGRRFSELNDAIRRLNTGVAGR